jgi:hypothetical protein
VLRGPIGFIQIEDELVLLQLMGVIHQGDRLCEFKFASYGHAFLLRVRRLKARVSYGKQLQKGF